MAFSYIIKVGEEFIAIDMNNADAGSIYWHTVKNKANAMNMSKDYAEVIITNVREYFPSASIVGVEYAQN